MAKIVKQRLCGGTFFTLFLRARKPLRGANEYYTGNPEPYSEPIALFALSKVIVPDWQNIFVFADSTVSGNTSEYKTCKNEGGSIYPFGDDAAMTNDEISNEEQSTEKELDASILTVTTTKRDIYIMEVLK